MSLDQKPEEEKEHDVMEEKEEESSFFDSAVDGPLIVGEGSLDSSYCDFVVATPSSSWTLLESMMEKVEVLAEEEEDDDGLALEEKRLEEVSDLLRELEEEAPRLTPEDVAFADEAVAVEKKERKIISRKKSAVGLALLLIAGVLLANLTFIVITFTLVKSPTNEMPEIVFPRVIIPKETKSPPPPPPKDLPESEMPAIPLPETMAPPFSQNVVGFAKERLDGLLKDANLSGVSQRVVCSLGLGALGLAVGVPYVPGITDNLVVGIAGAVLPLFSSNLDSEDKNTGPA